MVAIAGTLVHVWWVSSAALDALHGRHRTRYFRPNSNGTTCASTCWSVLALRDCALPSGALIGGLRAASGLELHSVPYVCSAGDYDATAAYLTPNFWRFSTIDPTCILSNFGRYPNRGSNIN